MQTIQGVERRDGRRPQGIEFLLAVLVVCVIGPVLLLAVSYGLWNLRLQEDALDQRLQDTARALSLAVDREVQSIEALLDGLASSPYLDQGDFRGFYAQADQLAARYGGWVVLTDPTMQQLVNTLQPFGEPLPPRAAQDDGRLVIESKKPVVTDLFLGRVARRWIVSVIIPVIRDDRVVYTLDMAFFPDRFGQLLADQNLPQGWFAVLIDRNDKVIARSTAQEQRVGKPAQPSVIDGLNGVSDGLVQGKTFDGVEVLLEFHRSERTGWRTAVAAPASLRTDATLKLAGVLAAGLLLSLTLAVGVSTIMGRRISRALKGLASSADAMVRGERVSFPSSTILEVAEVQAALSEATLALQERIEARVRLTQEQRAREAAERAHQEILIREAALRTSEERYRGLTEAIASVVWTAAADGRMATRRNGER